MPPLSLLIKPASGLCNLRCKYCFYADEMNKREQASYGVMSVETLTCVLEKAFAYAEGSILVAFQGGEPTLAGLPFFRKVVALCQKFNTRRLQVNLSIQTNGILLDDEWARFLAENRFLVGLSLDGTQALHDQNRVYPDDTGSFATVMERVKLLQKYRVDFNILTVVTRQTAGSIGKVYRFFRKHDLTWQQYIPCLDPLGEERGEHDYSLTPQKYEHFLKNLFDNWYQDAIKGTPTYNRYFENLLGLMLGQRPESCNMVGHCSLQHVVEADGSVYPCDFYVLDKYRLGNLCTDSFQQIADKCRELGFIEQSLQVHEKCKTCRWGPLCRGGCRRDREQADGTLGLNHYCQAYQGFFTYAAPRLQELVSRIRQGTL